VKHGMTETSCIAVVNLPFNKAKIGPSVSLLTALENQISEEGEITASKRDGDGCHQDTINRRNRRSF